MLQKYLFFEILNSEDPKKYEEFKNLVNYDFLIYFTKKRENNSKIDDFNLLNSYEKIFINKRDNLNISIMKCLNYSLFYYFVYSN